MANRPFLQKYRTLLALLCLFLMAGGYFVLRARAQRPVVFVQAGAALTEPVWRDGSWYWLEGVGKPGSRLIRANAAESTPVATAPGITSYAAGENKTAWTAKEGDRWTITLAASDGSDKHAIYSGEHEPRGLCLAGGRVFWLEQVPPVVPESGPLPPLTGSLRLVSEPIGGGAPETLTTLLESTGQQVIGIHDDQIYLSAIRPGSAGVTTIYRSSLTGGAPHRIAGETGIQRALLAQDGTLYWSAPSRESTQREKVVCIRRLGKDDKPETLTDWLPAGGQLYESGQDLYYIDGEPLPSIWPIHNSLDLPQALSLPQDFRVAALGNGEMLLQSPPPPAGNSSVYRMGLP